MQYVIYVLCLLTLLQTCSISNDAAATRRNTDGLESEIRSLKRDISSLESTIRYQRPTCVCE